MINSERLWQQIKPPLQFGFQEWNAEVIQKAQAMVDDRSWGVVKLVGSIGNVGMFDAPYAIR